MYVGVDVGGTKTLVAVFDGHGEILEQARFATPKNYDHWLLELRHAAVHFKNHGFKAGGAGLPGQIDRRHGRVPRLGNLPWQDANVQHDLEHIFDCPVVIENDAKMAAFSEALLVGENYSKVLYVTISTGMGIALVADKTIDINFPDLGGAARYIEYKGKSTSWDDFISGRAIVERYGQLATDITDRDVWQKISRDMSKIFIELIAETDPDVIVIGGSVGSHFEKYGELLAAELERYKLPLVTIPPLRKAQRPEEAVIYGCYELAKQRYSHAVTAG